MFLLATLIPACDSSSPTFHMIYSACKLNKQGDGMQPWHTPFPIWNQAIVPCPVLTVASWSAYRFLRRQIWWSVIPISLRIFYSLLWSTQSELTYLYFKIAHNSRRQPISVLYSREALLSRVVIMEIKEKADLSLLRVFLGLLRVLTPNWPWMSLL